MDSNTLNKILNDVPRIVTKKQQDLLFWLMRNPDPAEVSARMSEFRVSPQILEQNSDLTDEEKADLFLYKLASLFVLDDLHSFDSGLTVINDSPVIKSLIKGEVGDIVLGKNDETGETAIFTLMEGYLTPYEKEVLECISKFRHDGQVTERGDRTWFTIGQLYRAMRHGPGTTRVTKEQRKALLKTLSDLSDDNRRIKFKVNEYLKVWGGFLTNGGRLRIIGYDEYFGKIRGQEDLLIVLDNTPIICALAENLNMYECPPQEVKAIEHTYYSLKLKKPLLIEGKAEKEYDFASAAECDEFLRLHDIRQKDIVKQGESTEAWPLSENRIALRNVLSTFVYGYIRARAANKPKPYSNRLPYSTIFERCSINSGNREVVRRVKNDIQVIMDHFVKNIPELKIWREYMKRYSKSVDGIEIFVKFPKEV